MSHPSTDSGNRPRSFRLYRSQGKGGAVFLTAGFVWFVLSGFIAVPFREQWPFMFFSIAFFLLGIARADSKAQTVIGVALLLASSVNCWLSFSTNF